MRLRVAGLPLDALTVAELHDAIEHAVRSGDRARVLHLNAHAVVLARKDDDFRMALEEAEIVFCDGAGVRLAALIAGHAIPPRITYADWMWQFADFSSRRGLSWFLLGGVPGRTDAAMMALQDRYPALKVCGTAHGYFNHDPQSIDSISLRARIASARPDVLIVGFGMPVQEAWLRGNWPELAVPVALVGGAVFDYVAGATPRAPVWLRSIGLEWLGRLAIEPRRLWRRYILGLPHFLVLATWYAARSWMTKAWSAISSDNHDRI